MKKLYKTAQLVFAALLCSSAFATDGVLEINHSCATQLGCFGGDAVGYPVTIVGTAGNSYRLTSDLIVPDEFTTGIAVFARSISIDLNGFEIVRSGCESNTAACTPSTGTGNGVLVNNSSFEGFSIRNGNITGMGSHGLQIFSPYAMVENIQVRWNGSIGIRTGDAATVQGSQVGTNGGVGIFVGNGSMVRGNTVYNNSGTGIIARFNSTVMGNSARTNTGRGISAGQGATISDNSVNGNLREGIFASGGSAINNNTANNNGNEGIRAGDGSTVSGNTVNGNGGFGIAAGFGCVIRGNSVNSNLASGIAAQGNSLVISNAVRQNSAYGLALISTDVYRANVLTANGSGEVLGGYNMFDNFCDTNVACP